MGSRSLSFAYVCLWLCCPLVYISLPQDLEERHSIQAWEVTRPPPISSPGARAGQALAEWGPLGTTEVDPGGQGHTQDDLEWGEALSP